MAKEKVVSADVAAARFAEIATNATEPPNARHRPGRARGHFPTEQAALMGLCLVTRSLDPTRRGRAR